MTSAWFFWSKTRISTLDKRARKTLIQVSTLCSCIRYLITRFGRWWECRRCSYLAYFWIWSSIILIFFFFYLKVLTIRWLEEYCLLYPMFPVSRQCFSFLMLAQMKGEESRTTVKRINRKIRLFHQIHPLPPFVLLAAITRSSRRLSADLQSHQLFLKVNT